MKKLYKKLGKRITAMALVLLMLASSGGASVFAEVAASPAPTAAAETQATPVPEDTTVSATEPTPTEEPAATEEPAPTEAPAPTETPAATEPAATQEPTEATPEPDQQPTPEPTEEAAATEQPAATPTEEPAPTASPDPTAAPADNGIAMMNESVEGTTAAAEPAAASQVKLVDIALGDNLDFKLTDSDGNPLTSIGKDQPFKISIEYVIDNLHIGEISADTQIFYEFPEMLDMELATDKDDITMPGYGIAGSYTLSKNQETQKWELVFSFNEEFLKSRTNIEGTDNMLHAAIEANVELVVCLSTDKAAYPINAMGISKAMMEHVITANARVSAQRGGPVICCTRYGNVMCSRGSVIPLFVEQIRAGNPLTITNPDMTRFLMNLDEAVDLVMFAF